MAESLRTCPATGAECPIDTRLDEAIEGLPVSEQMGFMMVIQRVKEKRAEAGCSGPITESMKTGTQIICASETLVEISRIYKNFRDESDHKSEMPKALSFIIKNQ